MHSEKTLEGTRRFLLGQSPRVCGDLGHPEMPPGPSLGASKTPRGGEVFVLEDTGPSDSVIASPAAINTAALITVLAGAGRVTPGVLGSSAQYCTLVPSRTLVSYGEDQPGDPSWFYF